MGDSIRVRSPLAEGLLVLGQGALAKPGRTLTVQEETLLRSIFKDSIDYDVIRVALTDVAVNGRPYTLANTIRVPPAPAPPSGQPPQPNFTPRTLVHETTHVWQYQTQGSGYISDSMWHQVVEGSDAYRVTLAAGRSIYSYSAERQAVIVEGYYVDLMQKPQQAASATDWDPNTSWLPPLGWSLLPDVVRMIGEIQRARPLSNNEAIQERIFGPGWNAPNNLPPSPGGERSEVLPILRIEF
jgi:hypothetical protein